MRTKTIDYYKELYKAIETKDITEVDKIYISRNIIAVIIAKHMTETHTDENNNSIISNLLLMTESKNAQAQGLTIDVGHNRLLRIAHFKKSKNNDIFIYLICRDIVMNTCILQASMSTFIKQCCYIYDIIKQL